jgi:predicted chitinase
MTPQELAKYEADVSKQYSSWAPSMMNAMTLKGWGPEEKANILHQFKFESNGVQMRPENLNYRPEVIVAKFGDRPHFAGMNPAQKLAEAKRIVSLGPVAIADAAYGGILGNARNEGYKYRGRGFVQLTGKENYQKIGERLKLDLVNNPDLILKDPKIDEMVSLEYMKWKQEQFGYDFKQLRQVSKAITPEKFEHRMELAGKRKIVKLNSDYIGAMTPAEDDKTLALLKEGKISLQTYYENRGW